MTTLRSPNMPAYALHTRFGDLVLHPNSTNSRSAEWAGLGLRLGFAPKVIGGELFLHTLDLQKSLIPLLSPVANPVSGSRVIVLDPGHGGKDAGSHSVTRQPEKDYTLDWARRLQPLLEASGWRVFLTRTDDSEVPLQARVEFAESHRADVFVSLHFNSTSSSEAAGVETYCLTPTGMPSAVPREFEDNPALSFPNNHFDTQNILLALRLHREMVSVAGVKKDRDVRRARFMTVLRGQNRPAVLIEGGYLSNPTEAARVDSADYRQKLAEAVARALQ